tara:strand:- start:525 stop:1148 length:624 start_codon:yes stop_codon:yes gene_type:complete
MPAGDIKVLKQVMKAISEKTDRFIILSTHDDVDIVVPPEEKQSIIDILTQLGFKGIINEPRPECLYYAEPQIQFFYPDFYDNNKCHIDLQTGLYYKGLVKDNVLVPVDLKFQNYIYDTRVKTDDMWKYTLSPEANVVHTVCRIIWDKKKTPPHYEERLNKLINECDFNKLSYAFDIALFKFGKKALELVKNRQFKNLFEEYITYINY